MNADKLQMSTTTDGKPPRPGFENAGAPAPIDPRTGQHEAYWVLSEEERSKGFVRPVRRSYRHVGKQVCGKQRCENGRLGGDRDICCDTPGHVGDCFHVFQKVSQPEGARAEREHLLGGCGYNTSMGRALAETYARNPKYYGSTFCVNCNGHFPVGEHGEFVWLDDPGTGQPTDEKVGT